MYKKCRNPHRILSVVMVDKIHIRCYYIDTDITIKSYR